MPADHPEFSRIPGDGSKRWVLAVLLAVSGAAWFGVAWFLIRAT